VVVMMVVVAASTVFAATFYGTNFLGTLWWCMQTKECLLDPSFLGRLFYVLKSFLVITTQSAVLLHYAGKLRTNYFDDNRRASLANELRAYVLALVVTAAMAFVLFVEIHLSVPYTKPIVLGRVPAVLGLIVAVWLVDGFATFVRDLRARARSAYRRISHGVRTATGKDELYNDASPAAGTQPCSLCKLNVRQIAYAPCGHYLACFECERVRHEGARGCQLCARPVEAVVRIYTP
jgi:hypothetical protein